MPNIISGVRASGNMLAANIKPDIDPTMRVLKPYQTPITQFMFWGGKKSRVVTAKTGKFGGMEDEFVPHQTTVSATITDNGDSTITLTTSNCANVAFFKLNSIVYVEDTDEMGYISTVTSSTSVKATKFSGSWTTISNTGTYIKSFGTVTPEDASSFTALSTQEVEVSNYCTIFTSLVSNTGRDQAGLAYSDGTTHAEQVKKAMEEMKLDWERLFTLSNTSTSIGSNSTIRTIGKGLKGYLTTNITPYTGTLNEDTLDDHFSVVLEKGSGVKHHYCGSGQFNAINKIIKDKGNLVSSNEVITKYGTRLKEYYHGQGLIKLIWDPILDGKFTNWGKTVDPENIYLRHMANDETGSRKLRIEPKVQIPGADYKSTKILSDIAIEYCNEKTGGILYKAA